MALSATQTSIVQLVTAMFNAAPGKDILADLEALVNGGRSLDDLANDLSGTGVFKTMYPPSMTDNAFAVAFIDNLVGTTLTDENKALAVLYTEGQLNSGLSRANTMKAVSDALLSIDNTDANFGTASLTLENKMTAAANYSETQSSTDLAVLQGAISSVTDDPATIPPVVVVPVAGKSFTLTTAADSLAPNSADVLTQTTADDDTITATEATLGSADILDGGAGNDTLRYASSDVTPTNAAVSEAGFTTTNIETIKVTADNTLGTTFDVTGVDGMTAISNDNSSQNLTLTGLANLVAVGMNNVSGGNTNVQYKNSVLSGAADVQELTLSGNTSNADAAVSSISIGNSSAPVGTAGIETLNITTSGSASKLTDITTGAATINVTGDKDLTVGVAGTNTVANALGGATAINASTFTGNLSVITDSNGTAKDVVVTGGTGDDTANFSQGFEAGDSFVGGEGTDTIGLTNALATATPAGSLTSVETLDVTDIALTGTVDMDNFAGVSKVIYNAGITGGNTATVGDAVTGITVEVDAVGAGVAGANGSLTVNLKTDGTADEVTVELDNIDAALETIATITVDDAETLNISADDDSSTGLGSITVNTLDLDAAGTVADLTTLKLSGDSDLTITNFDNGAAPAVTAVDASGMTGALGNTALGSVGAGAGLSTSAAGAVYTFGAGGTDWTMGAIVGTQTGGDTINMGAGADTVRYNNANQSSGVSSDTIMNFTQGSDVLNLVALGVNTSTLFLGNVENTTAAETALTGVAGQAVFITSENVLIVDLAGLGTIGNGDLRIKLDGITALTAADLGFGTGVTFTANQAAFNTATAAHSTEANILTNENDTINATVLQLVGSTINGLIGTDTLNVSATAAGNETADLNAIAGNVSNLEAVNIDSSVETVLIDNGSLGLATANLIATVAGVSGTTQTLSVDGTVSLAPLTVTNLENLAFNSASNITIDEDNFASFSGNITGSAGADTLTLTGNAATDDFDFTSRTLTAVETLSLATADDVTVDAADLTDVIAITGAAGSDIFFNGSTNIDGIAVTDGAVASANFGANTLTIDNDGVADDIAAFESFVGTAGSALVLTDDANATFANGQLTGVTTLNASALITSRTLTIGTGIDGLAVTLGAVTGANNLNLASSSALTVDANAITATGTLDVSGSGALTINNFDGDDLDNNAGTGALVVNLGTGTPAAVNIQANATAASTTINAANHADGSVLTISGDGAATVTNVSQSDVTMAGTGALTVTTIDGAATQVITGGTAGDTITIVTTDATDSTDINGLAGVDNISLSLGQDDVTITSSFVTDMDIVTGFTAGDDKFVTGNAGAAFTAQTIATASNATLAAEFQNAVTAAIGNAATNWDGLGDTILVTVSAGTAAGTYLVSNNSADAVYTAATDFAVEVVGVSGVLSAADVIA